MAKFYAVVRTSTYETTNRWYYKNEANARKKFDEVAKKIKDRWGYNTRYSSEYPNGDYWDISKNKVEYSACCYDGAYDYDDRVVLKSVRSIIKPRLKFED